MSTLILQRIKTYTPNLMKKIFTSLLLGFLFISSAMATTQRYRLMFNDDPATTITIGWEQVSGTNQKVYYGKVDQGRNYTLYTDSIEPYRSTTYMGMNNQFAKIDGLEPNTAYYFVIRDSEDTTARYWFKTCPNVNTEPLSFISGGDSRSGYTQRIATNKMVAKIRPHAVLFGGDLTNTPSDQSTQDWLDHWQYTTTSDGQMIPAVHSFGNHEALGTGGANYIRDLFDCPVGTYYKVTFGGDLFSVYTLNGELMPGRMLSDPVTRQNQLNWLTNTLPNDNAIWKAAQYHHPMLPHNSSKVAGYNLFNDFADLFYDNGVRLVMESDAHVVKVSKELKPENILAATPNNTDTWFATTGIDVNKGINFIGEGSWGTLRTDDETYPSTLVSGSFYQFNWVVVTPCRIITRSIDTQNPNSIPEHAAGDHFSISDSLDAVVWKPAESNNGKFYIDRNCGVPFSSFNVEQKVACVGESISFFDQSENTPTTYKWYFGDGDSSSLRNPNHIYSNPGTYTVKLIVSNANGSDSRELKDHILVNPSPVLTVNNDTTICENEPLVLFASGADSYEWNNALGTGNMHTVQPTSTMTFSVEGTTAGCTSTEDILVNVNPLPTLTVSSNQTICEGETVNLAASGASVYDWDNGLGTGDNHDVSPNTTTTYTVTGIENGCSATESIEVVVNAAPTLIVSNDSSICEGNSIILQASGSTNYTWSNGLASINQHSVSPIVTTTYYVTASENGCSKTDSITVIVNANPDVSINASIEICEGESTLLEATGATNYTWINLGAGATQTVSPNQTATYKVYGESNGCIDSAEFILIVNPSPSLTLTNDSEICFGDSIDIAVSGADTYAWTQGLGNGDFYRISPVATTTFEVTGTTGNCSSVSSVTITVNELPEVVLSAFTQDTICETQGAVALPEGSPQGGSYFGTGVAGTSFDPATSGLGDHVIVYEYTDNKGCVNEDSKTIHVTECLEIVEDMKTIFNIYPNPAQEQITIERANASSYTTIQIVDAAGRIVFNKQVKDFPLDINIASWARGTYYIQFSEGAKTGLKKKIILN